MPGKSDMAGVVKDAWGDELYGATDQGFTLGSRAVACEQGPGDQHASRNGGEKSSPGRSPAAGRHSSGDHRG